MSEPRAAQRDPLSFPAREVPRSPSEERLDLEPLCRLSNLLLTCSRERQVFGDAQVGKEARVLRNERGASLDSGFGGLAQPRLAEDRQPALRANDPSDGSQERALPDARGPHHGDAHALGREHEGANPRHVQIDLESVAHPSSSSRSR